MNTPTCWPIDLLPIVLVGPTATGKTAAALELARRLGGEIINADSMQVYCGMDIGTAKPTVEERGRVRFHLLDIITPEQPFTVADWKARAEAAIAEVLRHGHRPILCGGTGLYIRALLEDWSLAATPADPVVRQQLQSELERSGATALHLQLQEVDPAAAARLHPNDAVRIVRALEVYRITGTAITDYQQQDRLTRHSRPAHLLGLTLPRPALYARIEARVDSMLAAGLEAEVRGLLDQGYSPTLGPLRSLGYKEMVQYLYGDLEYPLAVEQIKQNTRRYSKRQQTWFHADPQITWFDVSALSSATVADRLEAYLMPG